MKKKARISGLVREVNLVHREISDWARQLNGGPSRGFVEALKPLDRRLEQLVGEVEHALGGGEAVLPDPSRRAYQWAAFMVHEGALAAHSHTVTRIWSRLRVQRRAMRRYKKVDVRLAHIASLYRVRFKGGEMHLQMSEGYLYAPDDVLEAMIDVAIDHPSADPRRVLRSYAGTESYRMVVQGLERSGLGLGCRDQGRYHSLQEAFNRVNEQYFQGRISPPKLCWGARWAVRKLGQYDASTDCIQVSPALDQPDIPSFMIDYVMYHELLHKHLGMTWCTGRRLAHTAKFREEERKFLARDQAQAFLQRWSPERPSR